MTEAEIMEAINNIKGVEAFANRGVQMIDGRTLLVISLYFETPKAPPDLKIHVNDSIDVEAHYGRK
jgi:hypothetical protein